MAVVRARSRWSRIGLLLVLVHVGTVMGVATSTPSSAATGEYAEMGAPFGGKWAYNVNVNPPYTDANSSHPAVHLISGGGDFATDFYGTPGQDVRLRVNNPTGALSFSWASSSTSCGSSTRVNVLVDGVQVGWIYFAHLVNAVSSGPITNGMVLGQVGNYSCAPGQHIHIEVRADSGNFACYQDYGHPGTSIGDNAKFAGLGATGSGAIRQACGTPPTSGNPFGSFDTMVRAPGGAHVTGWVIDPDTTAATAAHFYGGDGSTLPANGAGALPADASRPDVAAAFPGYGPLHGVNGGIGLGPGHHNVCMYGINIAGGGGNTQLACKPIDVSPEPYGAFDIATAVPGGVRVAGWSIDPDVGAPTAVHVYGGTGVGNPAVNPSLATTANDHRSDVAAVYPFYGAQHGYSASLALPPGAHTVCTYGINVAGTPGSNQKLGCRAVTVTARLAPGVTIAAPRKVRKGRTFTVTGSMSGRDATKASETVHLWSAVRGGSWVEIGKVTTSGAAAAYSFAVTLKKSAQFMVTVDESFTEAKASSPAVAVKVKRKHRHRHHPHH